MKINLQMFGGRGANSLGKRATTTTSNQPQSIEEKFPIPNNITKKQKEVLEKIRRIAVRTVTGDKYENESEIKKFDVQTNEYSTSVVVTVGRKNDEGTMAEVLARDTAMIFIGKNGGMKHMAWKDTKLRRTKYLSQAFYDYTYRR